MHTANKSLRALVCGAAVAAALGSQALANTITVTDVSTTGSGPYTWTYNASHSNGRIFANEGRVVIYDFYGYVPGSATAPANWSFHTINSGGTSAGVDAAVNILNPDDASAVNLCWTYTGPLITTPSGGFTDLGNFSAKSIYRLSQEDYYGTQDRGLPARPNLSGSFGPINVPLPHALPDGGSSMALLGTALLAVEGLRRKFAK